MGTSVKLDEDLSSLVAEPLLRMGHTVASVVEQGWSGLKDAELWKRVVAEGGFFVTADKGFGDIRTYAPGEHPGILILRADRESILEYRTLLEGVATKHDLKTLEPIPVDPTHDT